MDFEQKKVILVATDVVSKVLILIALRSLSIAMFRQTKDYVLKLEELQSFEREKLYSCRAVT